MSQLPLTLLPNKDWTYTVLSSMFNILTEWDTLEDAIQNWKEAIQCHINWYKKQPDIERYSASNFEKSFTTFVSINT